MSEAIPATFGDEFLAWFRRRTEAAWASDAPLGTWQRGTRWAGGLSAGEIAAAERRWNLRFPPDYRRFLRRLHTTDRPMMATRYGDDGRARRVPRPTFTDWRDEEAPRAALDWPLEGILFDVERADLWLPSWGVRPATEDDRAARVRELVAAAPPLIPVFGHRYLLGKPVEVGNPVLSVYQSDIIIYGGDLRRYLLRDFASLLGIGQQEWGTEEEWHHFAAVPFWGAVAEP